MSIAVFIGTFDPLHGAHVGQLLRAHRYKPFSRVNILVDKHPTHKPHASTWQHRLTMAGLTLGAIDLPFDYRIMAVENSWAPELQEAVDCKITGIDSLLENITDKYRWDLALRWPMIVLSVPDMDESELTNGLAALAPAVQREIQYEYVRSEVVPIMNYDFEKRSFISRRIHATYVRAGRENTLVPPEVRQYIQKHALYRNP